MKYLVLILMMIYVGVCDEYTLRVSDNPTLGVVTIHDSDINYAHTDTNDVVTATLDSFSLIATDMGGNNSENTQLYVLIIPKLSMHLYIVPNPMEIVGHNVKKFSTSFDENFNISMYGMDNEGSAVVLLFDRDINPYESTGRIRIFDAVGNMITDYMPIHFGKNQQGQSVGVCVWNGRNIYGRVVGPASYVVYVEVHVVADMIIDDAINDIDTTYMKVIGVKYK